MSNRIMIAILTGALIAGVGAYFLASGVAIPNNVPVRLVIPAAIILLLIVFVVRTVQRSGSGSQGGPKTAKALAEQLGYDYVRKPDKRFRTRFAHIPEIKHGENKHAISGDLDGRHITFFNNSYIIPAGQVMIPVMHCVFTCVAPNWPSLSIVPRTFWSKLFAWMSSRRGIVLENQAFNDAFTVTCKDESFAITLLSPEMQEFMLEKNAGLKWRIGSEMLCMVYSGTLKLQRVPASLDRMRRFWALVPLELENW